MRTRVTPMRLMMLLVIIAHLAVVPLTFFEGKGAEKMIFSGYYLADYNIPVPTHNVPGPMTLLATRGEVFVPFAISLLVRFCDALKLPIAVSFRLALWFHPLLNLTAIGFAFFLGSSLFDKETGECFGILLGLSYFFWPFGNRTCIETICATLMLASTYFFWKCCIEGSREWRWYVLWGLFSAFAFEATYFGALLVPFYLSFIFFTRRIDWLRTRNMWLGIGMGFISFIPFFYLNFIHTGSPIGPILNLVSSGFGIRSSRLTQFGGFFLYSIYVRTLHFCLPFPNFVFFAYGIYLLLRRCIGKENQPHLFALLFLLTNLGGMIFMVTYFIDWYLPILMPPLVLTTSVGLRGVHKYLSSSSMVRRYSSILWAGIFLLSAIAIDQRQPFFVYHVVGNALPALRIVTGDSSHFFSVEKLLSGFAYSRIVHQYAEGGPLQYSIEILEVAGKTYRPVIFHVMVFGYYVLLAIALLLGLHTLYRETLDDPQKTTT